LLNGENLYTYVGNDPLDKTDPSGDAGELFGGYSVAELNAMAQFAGAQPEIRAAKAAALGRTYSYENRQVAERSVAAVAAVAAVAQPETAPVAAPVSVVATLTAVVDKAVSTGKIDGGDLAVTALSVAPAGAAAHALTEVTEVTEVGEVFKAGQEAMHAGAAAMGAEAALAEKKLSQSEKPAPTVVGPHAAIATATATASMPKADFMLGVRKAS
jgi:hypothetical protein